MTANTRFRPDYSQGRPYEVSTPSAGDILIEAAKIMRQDYQTGLDRAERGYEAEQKRKQYEAELGFKTRAEGREIDQINRDRLKEQYQADAVSATLDPDRFKANKIANERAALDASIAGLPQNERESILKQYDPTVSGNQWVNSTIASPYVNQSDLVKTKSADMDMKLSDPNSKEFKALQDANIAQKEREAEIAYRKSANLEGLRHKYDLAKIQAEKSGSSLVDVYSVDDRGNVVQTKVPSTGVETYMTEMTKSGNKVGLGTIKLSENGLGGWGVSQNDKIPTKELYSEKAINDKIASINTWNITTGDRDTALEKVKNQRKMLEDLKDEKGNQKFSATQINNLIGGSLDLAISDGGFDSDRLNEAIENRIGDVVVKPSTQNGVLELPKTTEIAKPVSKEEPKSKPVDLSGISQDVVDKYRKEFANTNGGFIDDNRSIIGIQRELGIPRYKAEDIYREIKRDVKETDTFDKLKADADRKGVALSEYDPYLEWVAKRSAKIEALKN